MKKRTIAVVLALVIGAIAALPVLAATPKITGTVGPGFTISLKKPTKAGKYTLVVSDKSSIHNFHLTGEGVDVNTGVSESGTDRFDVTVTEGTYTFVCDPHAGSMNGDFDVSG